MGSENWTQAYRLHSKYLYPMSHVTGHSEEIIVLYVFTSPFTFPTSLFLWFVSPFPHFFSSLFTMFVLRVTHTDILSVLLMLCSLNFFFCFSDTVGLVHTASIHDLSLLELSWQLIVWFLFYQRKTDGD